MSGREDWLGRWREGRTGWHEAGGSGALRRHWPRLPTGSRVLVPLCGKAVDLRWLADRGHAVVGVELSPVAVEAFFREQGLSARERPAGGLTAFEARGADITIYCGDYFDFAGDACEALFDRGALVAIEEDRRPAYAAHTDGLLAPGATRLVVTLEYDASRASGPPYSVPADELLGYWPDLTCVERRDDLADAPPKFREAGLQAFHEAVWLSTARDDPDRHAGDSPPRGP